MHPPYVPLWLKSNFSFLEGASHPEELVDRAAQLGLPAMALTDRDGVYGVVRAHVRRRQLLGAGVFDEGPADIVAVPRLLIGAQVSVADGSLDGLPEDPWSNAGRRVAERPPPATSLILLATDRPGYANLCRLLTAGRRRLVKGLSRVTWDEVCAHAGGLIALWGGAESALVRPAEPPALGPMRDAFGDRLYALAARHHRAEEVPQETRLLARAAAFDLPVVAGAEVLYHRPARRDLQDVLTAIRHRVTLREAGRLLRPNGGHALPEPAAFAARFVDRPAWVARTVEVADRCRFSLDQLRYRYPSERLPDGLTTAQWLRRLAEEGAEKRFPAGVPRGVRATLEKELALIEELDYCGYFLTMYELVRFCRREGILCQGRGSAANSVVCYCLGVTAVSPGTIDVLFERFLSRERAEPPDIDLDISHAERERVIQHLYEKHGRDRAALTAVVIRFRARSAIRQVGKALGIPETGVERLAKLNSHGEGLDAAGLAAAGLHDGEGEPEPALKDFLRMVQEIRDFPRHLSIHPGGFLLGHEPVHDIVPVENGSMEKRTVIQWDKDDLEDLGLFKVDLLGLGALTQLSKCFELIREHHGRELCMATIPEDDPATYRMIQAADTVGVFQIESRAQMSMLPRLKPENFYDLVIEVSIVRPGPITGGMVHPYLRRRRGEEVIEYPHPCLEEVLGKTFGVPLFQEQVMRVAIVAADYSPGEADQLRRDMAAWRRSGRIERHRERLIERMANKGIAREFAERVFDQIRGFGEYGFPESHAASFALIVYATSWVKCHYPEVFAAALLNAQPMGFYSPATIVGDARRHGVEIRPADVTRSGWDCTLEPAGPDVGVPDGGGVPRESAPGQAAVGSASDPPRPAIRMGLRFVKGLSEARDGARIVRAREAGPFRDLDDFARRSRLQPKILRRLAEAGALQALHRRRRQALWDLHARRDLPPNALPLTRVEAPAKLKPLDAFEEVTWDYRASSHSARGHPLEGLREAIRDRGMPTAREVWDLADGARTRYAGLVICRQRPGTAGGVTFMTLEDETGFVNVIIWKRVAEKYPLLVKTARFLGVWGKIQAEVPDPEARVGRGPGPFPTAKREAKAAARAPGEPRHNPGVVNLVADTLFEPRLGVEPASLGSRDFH